MSPELFMWLDIIGWLLRMLADIATIVIALGVAVLAFRSVVIHVRGKTENAVKCNE